MSVRAIQPIVLWLAGIVTLIVLLIVRGGFKRPVVYAVLAVLVVALVVGFFVFGRVQSREGDRNSGESKPPAPIAPLPPNDKPRID